MKLQRRRGPALAAAIVVAAMALTGCDQSPGVAAKVGDTTISTHDLDLMTQALCTSHSQGQGGATSVATVRKQALNALIESTLDHQFATKLGVPANQNMVNQEISRYNALFKALPADDRARTRQLLGSLFRGTFQIQQVGAAQMQQQGKKYNPQAALTAGQKLRKKFDAKQDIDINPRFDTPGVGHVRGSGSLSVAKSDFAKKAGAQQPDPTWVSSLPKTQTCG